MPPPHRAAAPGRCRAARSSSNVAPRSSLTVIDALGWLALAGVAVLLAAGLNRQFVVVGRRGELLDRLALVPQWKFFGQAHIAADETWADDLYLLARVSPDPATPGSWRNVLWWDDRPLGHALWNPALRSRSAVSEALLRLIQLEADPASPAPPTALAYLTALRHCLTALPPGEGAALQFALVTTRGRGGADGRPLALRFLSAWHTP